MRYNFLWISQRRNVSPYSSPGRRKKFLEPLARGGGKRLDSIDCIRQLHRSVSRGWQPRKLRTKLASSVERRNRSRVFGSARMTGSAFARRAMGCRGMLPAGLDGARSTPTRPPAPPCTFATGSQTYLRRNSGFFILLSFPNNLMPTMGKITPLGARSARTTTARARRKGSDREERETDITTSMNIWEISASRSTRPRLRLGRGMFLDPHCGELFALSRLLETETSIGWILFMWVKEYRISINWVTRKKVSYTNDLCSLYSYEGKSIKRNCNTSLFRH